MKRPGLRPEFMRGRWTDSGHAPVVRHPLPISPFHTLSRMLARLSRVHPIREEATVSPRKSSQARSKIKTLRPKTVPAKHAKAVTGGLEGASNPKKTLSDVRTGVMNKVS